MPKRKRVPRLFYADPECETCPMSLYDFNEDEWISNTSVEPKPGDHVVVDGQEKVLDYEFKYRNLSADDVKLWDEVDIPDETAAVGTIAPDDKDDPYFRLQSRIHTLSHW